jgi:plastocyanin
VHRISVASSLTLLVLSFAAGCSDDEGGGSGAGGSGASGAAGGSGGGAAGGGGDGGSGGAPLGCGDPITFEAIHGCDVATLTDLTAESAVTIGYGFSNNAFVYDPKCVHVCAGTAITFDVIDGTNFQIHPLQGGVAPTPDPESPIPQVSDAGTTSVTFSINEPGSYGYYCIAHVGSGMVGAIYVQ